MKYREINGRLLMIFEEALKALRAGAKIRHPSFEEDVYLQGCYVGLIGMEETFEETKSRGMSIAKMKGNKKHPDMYPSKTCSPPQLNLFLVMADNWETVR